MRLNWSVAMRWLAVMALLAVALVACGGDSESGAIEVHDAWSLPVSVEATSDQDDSATTTPSDHDDMDDMDDDSSESDDHTDDMDDDSASDDDDDMDMGHEMSGGATAVVFFVVDNDSDEDDQLVGVGTDVADVAEMHFSEIDDAGVMRMNPVDGVDIPAGESVAFESGGYHVMLIGLHEDLVAGESFKITLEFAEQGDVEVEVDIREP